MQAVRIFSLPLDMTSATNEPLKLSMYISVHRQTKKQTHERTNKRKRKKKETKKKNKHANTLTLKYRLQGNNYRRDYKPNF
jgi:hypothetical protein